MATNHRVWHRRLFPTAHKLLLHREIDPTLRTIAGNVLVIGAGKEPYRSILKSASSVCLTDIGPMTDCIDTLANAESLPFADNSFDAAIAIEVFEHVERPVLASQELRRVLKPGSIGLVSIPFLFRVHGDPNDYQRLTESGIRILFEDFTQIKVEGFGGRRHVISDIVTTFTPACAGLRVFNHLLAAPVLPNRASKDCPSGYVVKLVK